MKKLSSLDNNCDALVAVFSCVNTKLYGVDDPNVVVNCDHTCTHNHQLR